MLEWKLIFTDRFTMVRLSRRLDIMINFSIDKKDSYFCLDLQLDLLKMFDFYERELNSVSSDIRLGNNKISSFSDWLYYLEQDDNYV